MCFFKNIILLFLTLITFSSFGQEFLRAFSHVDRQEEAVVITESGDTLIGRPLIFKRKSGFFKEVLLKNDSKQEYRIPLDNFKSGYIPQKRYSKNVDLKEYLGEGGVFDSLNFDKAKIKEGYAYFEKTTLVDVKGRKESVVLQLANPGACNAVKVFHNPKTRTSMSVPPIEEGYPLSYYFKAENKELILVGHKENSKFYTILNNYCIDEYKVDKKWNWLDLERGIFKINNVCK